jgi:putative PIN family toxin of toxin-antitoxin system
MGKKTKVVIDNNLLISAFGWGGTPQILVRLVTTGQITNLTSMALLEELARAIGYPKLKFPESLQAEIIETVFAASSLITVFNPVEIKGLDPADNRILECAVDGKADYIVSGDKHLLDLDSYEGIPIVKATEFLGKEGFMEK